MKLLISKKPNEDIIILTYFLCLKVNKYLLCAVNDLIYDNLNDNILEVKNVLDELIQIGDLFFNKKIDEVDNNEMAKVISHVFDVNFSASDCKLISNKIYNMDSN